MKKSSAIDGDVRAPGHFCGDGGITSRSAAISPPVHHRAIAKEQLRIAAYHSGVFIAAVYGFHLGILYVNAGIAS